MSYPKLALVVGLSAGLSACASTYTRQTVTAATSTLVTTGSVLVAVPHDGSYGGDSYTGSGSATADAVRSAFSRYSNNVQVASGCSELDCLQSSSGHYEYYVVPQILHWEDRATEWSGKKDKIEIKISVYSTGTAPIASQVINGKSKWATFGGDHPQDLLPKPINEYVTSLYR